MSYATDSLRSPALTSEVSAPPLTFSTLATVGLCLCCPLLMFALQLFGVYIGSLFYYEQAGDLDIATLIMLSSNNGVVVAMSVLITALLFTLFAVGLVYLKSHRISQAHRDDSVRPDKKWQRVWRFFGIQAIHGKGLAVSMIGMIVFMGVSELILLGLDSSPMDFLHGLINEASLLPLIFAIVVVAPIYEELVFRGLIFGALYHTQSPSKMSVVRFSNIVIQKRVLMASLVSSALFSLVHLQYDLIGMTVIFAMALFFTFVRIKYGLIMAILMHMINNGVAMGVYLMG